MNKECVHCGYSSLLSKGKQELLYGWWMCEYCLEDGKGFDYDKYLPYRKTIILKFNYE